MLIFPAILAKSREVVLGKVSEESVPPTSIFATTCPNPKVRDTNL